MAKPKKVKVASTRPRILVHDMIRYYRNGTLHLTATFIGRSVFGDKEEREERGFEVPQPKQWATDAPVLAAVRAAYPNADVSWRSDDEPQI